MWILPVGVCKMIVRAFVSSEAHTWHDMSQTVAPFVSKAAQQGGEPVRPQLPGQGSSPQSEFQPQVRSSLTMPSLLTVGHSSDRGLPTLEEENAALRRRIDELEEQLLEARIATVTADGDQLTKELGPSEIESALKLTNTRYATVIKAWYGSRITTSRGGQTPADGLSPVWMPGGANALAARRVKLTLDWGESHRE